MRFSDKLSTSVLAIATGLLIATPVAAWAQDAAVGPGGAQAQEAQAEAPSAEEATTADVVVTGSRVVANGNESPTPVTVVSIEQIRDVNPNTVAEQLNELPQFAGSQGQATQAQGGSANAGNPNAQGNVLNLRNFGFTRNLVLYDGHRVAPNSANGTVDIDLIPQLLLQRVDIVTGGASAVYGSDAVTGVVNFITDTKFRGVRAQAQAGVSSRGDGATKDLGAAFGTDVGDRGHLLLSYQYRNDEGIDTRQARQWGRNRYQIGQISNANGVITQGLTSFAGRPGASFGGTIQSVGTPANPLNNFYFVAPGVVAPVSGTGPLGTAPNNFLNTNVAGNSTGSYFEPSLKGALEFHQAFGRFDYDLLDGVHAYVRGAYTKTTNSAYAVSNPTYQASNGSNVHQIFIRNPTGEINPLVAALPAAVRDALVNSGAARLGLNKVYGGPSMQQYRQFTQAFGENWSVDGGLQGDLGSGWKWESSLIYSKNTQRVRANNAINGRKLAASLDVVSTPSGNQCYVKTIINTLPSALQGLYNDCIPQTSIFGPTITDAEAAYIFDPLEVTTTNRMIDIEGFVSGSPFSTWAGPVNVALSAQGREQSYAVLSSTTPATLSNPLNCTGLRLITCGATSLEYFQAESLSRPKISVGVKEAALEVAVPLLRDFTLAQDLTVNGAYRVTDYTTSGTVESWKVGLDWTPVDSLRFRATRSRDIRAPTLHELFAPQVVGNFNGTDVLLNVALDGTAGRPLPAGTVQSGNPNLRPELADTFTAGVVFKPDFVPGLSLAVDYYDIKVRDAIINLDGSLTTTQSDCINSGGSSATCDLIVRAGAGVNCATAGAAVAYNNCITRTFVRSINIGRQYTKGVDIELNYATQLAERPLSFRALVSYQPDNVFVDAISGVKTNIAGSATSPFAGTTGAPKWRGTLIANVGLTDNLRVSVLERYRGKMNWYPEFTGRGASVYVLQNAPANIPVRWYTNLNVAFKVAPGEFFLNVQNLFDQDPAVYANYTSGLPGNNGVAPGDDPVGRFFTAGVRVRF